MRRSVVVAGCVAGAVVVGCGSDAPTSRTLAVKGNEYSYVMKDAVRGGAVTFEVSNAGRELHEFGLARLTQGKTAKDLRADLAKRGDAGDPPPWVEEIGGVSILSPGRKINISRVLTPGRYVFACFISTPKGVPHWKLGMVKDFEVVGTGGALPRADAVVTAGAHAFTLPGLKAGRQTLELRNGTRAGRGFLILTFAPGKSFADVDQWAQNGFKGPAPATFLGAMQFLPPHASVRATVTLEAGKKYMLADPDNGIFKRFTVG